jgi:hypothetical protein
MPTYCYRTKSGEPVELVMTCAEMERRQKPDGSIRDGNRVLFRDMAAEHGSIPCGAKGWPMESDGAAVDPSQAKEACEYASELGVPTEFKPSGRPVFTSKRHRDRFLKAHGLHDRNSYC